MLPAADARSKPLLGAPRPRIAPPLPARSLYKDAVAEAKALGIDFMPWQVTSERYIEAVGPDGKYLYPEIAELVGRQNGKTEKLVPHIVRRLRAGRRIMHTAQNRELPREVFGRVADIFTIHFPGELKSAPRFANGQEEIRLRNGGHYRIVAPTRGGARGPSIDDLIIDEVRELHTHEFIAAAEPTQSASENPQTLYLSNEGDDESVVLKALRQRAGEDPSLAFLEWSADPDRTADDVEGWLEANPSVGHLPGKLDYLIRKYESYRLAGTLAIFETEHLCRAVPTMRERLVDESAWATCEVHDLPAPTKTFMGVSMDPAGRRAAAAVAWMLPDGKIAMRQTNEAMGSPIDPTLFGVELRKSAARWKVARVGYDPMTDGELAKFFPRTDRVSGSRFSNASARFVSAVETKKLMWSDAAAVTSDLVWTARKRNEEKGSFQAVRASDDVPIPAVLAAIRAVELASGPTPGPARIY